MKEKLNKLREKPVSELTRIKRRIAMQVGGIVLVSLTVCAILFGLTSAWYTNIVKQNSITVKTADWGVDVKITYSGGNENVSVGEDGNITLLNMYPGAEGDFTIAIENNGDVDADVRLDLYKGARGEDGAADVPMAKEMQRRLYFYVEGESESSSYVTRNAYINSDNEKIFRVPAGETVEKTIHYEWVRDVICYFVKAEVVQTDVTANDETTTTYQATDEEYLFPFAYDLDAAAFDPATGVLKSTNNGANAGADGWADDVIRTFYPEVSVNTATDKVSRYYMVKVDDPEIRTSGSTKEYTYTGTWLFVGTLDDIRAEIAYDTELGTAELRQQANAENNSDPGAAYEPANTFTVTMTFVGEPAGVSAGG